MLSRYDSKVSTRSAGKFQTAKDSIQRGLGGTRTSGRAPNDRPLAAWPIEDAGRARGRGSCRSEGLVPSFVL